MKIIIKGTKRIQGANVVATDLRGGAAMVLAGLNANGKTRHIIQVDHIIEKSQGGGERMNNLLVLCPNCHAKKTYGVIKINPDYTFEENGEKKILKQNKHLNQ